MPIDYAPLTSTFPDPFISLIKPTKMNLGKSDEIIIFGSYFTLDTTVAIGGAVIDSITFVSDNEIRLNVTAGNNEGFFNLTINNGREVIVNNAIEIKKSLWIDLRENGEVLTTGNQIDRDVRVRNGMGINRNAQGMYFTGNRPWSSWVKWEKYRFERNSNISSVFFLINFLSK